MQRRHLDIINHRHPSSHRLKISNICLKMNKFMWTVFIIGVLVWTSVSGCGPGRGGIRRRGAQKLTPLVFKEHSPNLQEHSVAASGSSKGIVSRSDERFRKLVLSTNPDIIFKDEERTGADRLMTQRCKEKLDTLAISVMNQWPGMYLRVTEAWDEDMSHSQNSLHYEGRALDITTSDRDRRKYGMLARLAVQSGFDWVYYESRSHIHASCKSEDTHPRSGGCFKGTSTVLTSQGHRKELKDLRVGEEILAVNKHGSLTFSPVLLFLDRSPEDKRQFYSLHTESGEVVTLTPSHLIYVLNENEIDQGDFANFQATLANNVNEGDRILIKDSRGVMRGTKVTQVKVEVHSGVYAPLTAEGNLVVDNVLVSCYALTDNEFVAHLAFTPFRVYDSLKRTIRSVLTSSESDNNREVAALEGDGVHWYAQFLYNVARWTFPSVLSRS